MKKNIIGSLSYFTFDLLKPYPKLRHGVFTRYGGASGDKTDLNLAFTPDDSPKRVLTNLIAAEKALGLGASASAVQIHGKKILFLGPDSDYRPRSPEELAQGYDALISSGYQSLLIKLADCQGVLIFDPESETLALIHNGWRGSVQNILGHTVLAMKEKLGLKPEKFLAAISPSLGPCCAEFKNFQTELPKDFWVFRNPDNNHFDFWGISQKQLTQAGLLPQNIEVSGLCTCCHSDFFSYRKGDSSRFGFLAGVTQ